MSETDLIDLGKNFDAALRKTAIYKLEHPVTKKAFLETYKLFTKLLDGKNELSLNIADGVLLIDGIAVNDNKPWSINLIEHFRKHCIDSITFSNGLNTKELVLAIKVLAAIPKSIEDAGGIKEILKKSNASHLKINETHYTKLGEDEKVINKDAYDIENEEDSESLLDINPVEEVHVHNKFEKDVLEEIRKLSNSSVDYQAIFSNIIDKFYKEVEKATEELKTENKTIKFEKKRTESVIKSMSDGIVMVDDKGKVLMMNPAAEKIMEIKKDEKIGANIMDGLKDHHIVSISNAANPDQEEKIKEINIEGSADTQKTIRSSMAIVENENGKTVGMISILTDITKQKELDRLKSEFQSKVTHELRTPLAAIKQTISLILEQTTGALNDIQKKFLTIAGNNIERLNRLVNDLLDLSKMEAGKMELKCEPASMNEVLDETVSTFQIWASEKKLTISYDPAQSIPLFSFDRDKITQVLTNLINNAIKFTQKGGHIKANALENKKEELVRVSVEDTGPGIAKEDLEKVFDKFVQVGKKGVSEIKGTGLGLPIAKEIIDLHKGKIWVESPVIEEKGTRFIFTLPLNEKKLKGKK